MKSFFVQIQKLKKSKIQILVGISVFVEDSKSLLPTLGRSANLSEPWAPRKDTSRSFAHFLQTYIVKYLAIPKVEKSKIEILVGISIFVEASKSLLPHLGAQ